MLTTFRGTLVCLLISLLLSAIVPCFFPHVTINFFAGPQVLLFYNASLPATLWLSFASGCLLDSLMLTPRFGFLGLSFVCTCRLLYEWRLYFFKDSRWTLPLMTFCFSFLCTIVQNVVAVIFDLPTSSCSLHWLVCDLFLMSLLDGVSAWLLFSLLPILWRLYCVQKRRRKEKESA